MNVFIEINGSMGEGGGQVLRTSLALFLCTGQSFRISHLRAKRKKPGLLNQHLTAVCTARKISGAEVQGEELGSTSLTFIPHQVHITSPQERQEVRHESCKRSCTLSSLPRENLT